mgnify:CR=1 FL=1
MKTGRIRAGALTAGLALWLAILALLAGAATASATTTYRDNFGAISWSGDDGTASWSGSWTEFGESDGPAGGKVRVVSDSKCASGNCAYLNGSGNTSAGVYRVANLDGAASATLSFNYRRVKSGGSPAIARISASSNGGSSWTTIAAYSLDTSDPSQLSASIGLTSWIASDTAIRFRVEASAGQGGRMYFDNVQISAEVPDPTTTTTTTQPPATTTTTTTQPPGPTTTTQPPGPTTTTTIPPVPTTTTTTTSPPVTTTSAPPPSTSLGPPDPTDPTTTVPPSTTAGPAPSTTLAPVALPVSGPISIRPPFPIDPAAGSALLGSGITSAVSPDLESRSNNADVSSLMLLALGEPVLVNATVGARDAGPAVGGIAYLWPGLLILAGLGGLAVPRRPGIKRPSK